MLPKLTTFGKATVVKKLGPNVHQVVRRREEQMRNSRFFLHVGIAALLLTRTRV